MDVLQQSNYLSLEEIHTMLLGNPAYPGSEERLFSVSGNVLMLKTY